MYFIELDVLCFVFFFQAEDGIRDYKVTGVQTCALPISMPDSHPFILHIGAFMKPILSQGTAEQVAKFIPLAEKYILIGTYAQTEIGHGK